MTAVRVGVGVLIPWYLGLLEAKAGAFCGSGMGWGMEERSSQGQFQTLRVEVGQNTTKGLSTMESATIP